ncbi:hypothetical protein D9601_04415 [Sphingomonas sp. MA1305]|nr:hypothetical protein [Sphingomonas sp. MA1305]
MRGAFTSSVIPAHAGTHGHGAADGSRHHGCCVSMGPGFRRDDEGRAAVCFSIVRLPRGGGDPGAQVSARGATAASQDSRLRGNDGQEGGQA